jgi:integrase
MSSPNIPTQLKVLWIGFTAYKSTHLNPNTIEKTYGYKERIIDAIPPYCSSSKDIVDWLERTYSNEVNRRFMESCIACYEWAVRTERVTSNPFMRYQRHFPKRSRPQRNAFTHEERNAIMEAFRIESPQFYPFIAFCFRTGCRHEEARGLEWGGVKQTYIHFYQAVATHFTKPTPTKTGETRTFPITPKIRLILNQQQGISDRWVFPSLTDNPIDPHHFRSRHWVPILHSLEKKGQIEQYLAPKHTRHTFISLSLRSGKEVTDIAKLVGNSAETIWKHYAATARDITVEDF